MDRPESMMFRVLYIFASFLTLQVIWVFFSLGIITIIPATIALYAVVSDWAKNGIDLGVWRPFYQSFKLHLKRTFILGMNISIIVTIVVVNRDMLPVWKLPTHFFVQAAWLFAISMFVITLLSIIPLMATSHLKGIKLWKNALVTSMSIFPSILLISLIGTLFMIAFWFSPILLTVSLGLFAFIHVQIWRIALKSLPEDFLDQCLLKYHYR